MRTEDMIAKDIRQGTISVVQALEELAGDTVYVYDAGDVAEEDRMWEDVEDAASGSSDLFASLQKVGATDDQLDTVGEHVQRLRTAGHTLESL